jgi:hypothetical protein
MSKPVGGFFELEVLTTEPGGLYHPDALALSTGRACIGYILDKLKPARCFVPSYTCDAVYEPFRERSIPLEYYAISDQFELKSDVALNPDEYLFYINYFGIRHDYSEHLIERYGGQLILDNTHSFFHSGYSRNWSFTSARKYFGVPDGAFVFGPTLSCQDLERFNKPDLSPNMLRALGVQDQAYQAYQAYEKRLNADVQRISHVSEQMLKRVDYDKVIRQRLENFQRYHKELADYNQITFDKHGGQYAFCYPFLPKERIEKQLLHQQNFFIPALWSDVLNREEESFRADRDLCLGLLPLPIDHRYKKHDVEPLIRLIKKKLYVDE